MKNSLMATSVQNKWYDTKKRIRFENTPRRIYTVIFLSPFLGISRFLGISTDEVIIGSKSHSPDMPNPEKWFWTW